MTDSSKVPNALGVVPMNDGSGNVTVTEGKATVVFGGPEEVFYNPVQVFNRDISTFILNMFAKTREEEARAKYEKQEAKRKAADPNADPRAFEFEGIKVLEALSATGLRSCRYAMEVDGVKTIMANDLLDAAVESIKRNVAHNNIPAGKVIPNEGDACAVMFEHRNPKDRFDVVDIDPYGSAAPFLDGAVQSVSDGGLLCVTCTDMAVMCGNHAEVCFSKYGSMPLKTNACHESALRILLQSIDAHANRHKRYIVPLVSISVDFYIRVFVRVYTSAAEVKRSIAKRMSVFLCMGCHTAHFQPLGKFVEKGNSVKFTPGIGPPVGQLCDECGQRFHVGGPLWAPPIHSAPFLERALKELEGAESKYHTHKKMYGMLSAMAEELPDHPLYYDVHQLFKVIHATSPNHAQLWSAIESAGYRATPSHTKPNQLKTDMPPAVMWDMVRAWAKEHPPKNVNPASPGAKLLSKANNGDIVFDFTAKKGIKSRNRPAVPVYLPNPEENWGPKARATGKRSEPDADDGVSARERNQNKRKKKNSCHLFKETGACKYGEDCRYVHEAPAGEDTPAPAE